MREERSFARGNEGPTGIGTGSILIAGPTAAGKSEIALLLAEKLGGEILSVDSMQVYRGLEIGTAKPSREDRARVPHHLLDVADLDQPFDASLFVQMAEPAWAGIRARGRAPVFCGGTGLYFNAWLKGLGPAPSANLELRQALEARPLAELLEELAASDPEAYASIDRRNPRRVIRALEVIRLTGRPFSAQRPNWAKAEAQSPRPCRAFGLARSPEDLRARIDARVDEMFRRGLVAETEDLLKRGLAENRTAMQALGYRQVAEYLRGERSLAATIELVKTRTRQFARRQMTWFRRQMELTWIHLDSRSRPEDVVQSLIL
jgi:tRNA dimethylallyltransferase